MVEEKDEGKRVNKTPPKRLNNETKKPRGQPPLEIFCTEITVSENRPPLPFLPFFGGEYVGSLTLYRLSAILPLSEDGLGSPELPLHRLSSKLSHRLR
ncbi:MAG: hypothetical protein U9N62_00435, partial [Thermotogota bacterium]|nr:hypothetical protein [Thermotogota bacterium]